METTTPQTGTLSRLFAKIAERREAKQRKAIESFADLVNRFWEFERGRGPEPTVDEVEAVLAASDRAPDDLESTLAYRRSILRNAEQAMKADEYLARVKAVREEMADLEKEFEAAKVKRERGIAAAAARLDAEMNASRDAHDALGRLGNLVCPPGGGNVDAARDVLKDIVIFAGMKSALFPGSDVKDMIGKAEKSLVDAAARRDELRKQRTEAILESVRKGTF